MEMAVIGCGEVGMLYARAMLPLCAKLSLCDPRPSSKTTTFSGEMNVPIFLEPGEWLKEADIILSCVVGTIFFSVATGAFPWIHKGALFVDMTTCDPTEIHDASRIAEQLEIGYVDIAIMGAVALAGEKTALLCAGSHTEEISEIFTKIGAPIRVLPDSSAGDASSLKLLRSVFVKGLEALAIETFMAAEKQGVTDQLYEMLSDIDQNPLRSTLESFVRTHLVHAPRRLKEIEKAESLLQESGLPVDVLPGVKALFKRTCSYLEKEPINEFPSTAREALEWLVSHSSSERS